MLIGGAEIRIGGIILSPSRCGDLGCDHGGDVANLLVGGGRPTIDGIPGAHWIPSVDKIRRSHSASPLTSNADSSPVRWMVGAKLPSTLLNQPRVAAPVNGASRETVEGKLLLRILRWRDEEGQPFGSGSQSGRQETPHTKGLMPRL